MLAGQREKERFVFFKYVPSKKDKKPLKGEEYSKTNESETVEAEGFGPPDYMMPGPPGFPTYPEEPGCPELPEPPELPELPEIPEFPECPEIPEPPEAPECPEIPELPEPPECPEEPEVPEMPEGPCPEKAVMHVIRAGDTFWKLAKKYGTTVEAITAANPEVDPLNLQIGETVCVPEGIPGAKG
ncbi:MAG: LysM domain-containing protein [Firmicutes bacterium]|nr:LysM domain-containing protein [Bacillota bacterium]